MLDDTSNRCLDEFRQALTGTQDGLGPGAKISFDPDLWKDGSFAHCNIVLRVRCRVNLGAFSAFTPLRAGEEPDAMAFHSAAAERFGPATPAGMTTAARSRTQGSRALVPSRCA